MIRDGMMLNTRLSNKAISEATIDEISNSKISAAEAFDQWMRCTPIIPPMILKIKAKPRDTNIAVDQPMCIGPRERQKRPAMPNEMRTVIISIVNQLMKR